MNRGIFSVGRHLLPCHNCLLTRGAATLARTHYDILGLKPDASQDEIKTSFVELSKKMHPDMNPDNPRLHEKFVELNAAYSVLSKPSTRKEYDLSLAARLYHHQYATQHLYRSYTHGSTHHPGATSQRYYDQEGEEQQRVFWDESIWYMRDRKKDKEIPEAEYYGIKGIKKMPNSYIVIGCFLFMALGTVFNYFYFKYTRQYVKRQIDAYDTKNKKILRDTKALAEKNGNKKQLELFKQRLIAQGVLEPEPEAVVPKT